MASFHFLECMGSLMASAYVFGLYILLLVLVTDIIFSAGVLFACVLASTSLSVISSILVPLGSWISTASPASGSAGSAAPVTGIFRGRP